MSEQRLLILRGGRRVVSQQLTATSSRDEVGALDTSGEVECTMMMKGLQLCGVMGREAAITPLYRPSCSMLRISAERDRWMMGAISLCRAQAIVLTPVLKCGLNDLSTLWYRTAQKDSKSLCLSFPDSRPSCRQVTSLIQLSYHPHLLPLYHRFHNTSSTTPTL